MCFTCYDVIVGSHAKRPKNKHTCYNSFMCFIFTLRGEKYTVLYNNIQYTIYVWGSQKLYKSLSKGGGLQCKVLTSLCSGPVLKNDTCHIHTTHMPAACTLHACILHACTLHTCTLHGRISRPYQAETPSTSRPTSCKNRNTTCLPPS